MSDDDSLNRCSDFSPESTKLIAGAELVVSYPTTEAELIAMLTDDVPRWITYSGSLPVGVALGAKKTIDGRSAMASIK